MSHCYGKSSVSCSSYSCSSAKENVTLAQASSTVANTVASLDRLRCDSAWKQLWNEICLLRDTVGSQGDDITGQDNSLNHERIPRRPNKVRRLEDFVIMSTCGQREHRSDLVNCAEVDDENQWKTQVFYPVIDSVVGEMRRRFLDTEIVKISKAADAVLTLNDADGDFQELLTTYSGVLQINPALLKAEMHVVRASVKGLERFNPANPERFCPPATVDEVAELKNYPNLFKLMQLVMTLPVSSATCERSFSAMRRVRNYLRTTMSEDRFSALSSLYIERDLSNTVDVHDVVAHYAAKANRRLQFY